MDITSEQVKGRKGSAKASSESTLIFRAPRLSNTALTATQNPSPCQVGIHTDIECLSLSRWEGVSGERKTVEVVETAKLVEIIYHRGQRSEIRDQLYP
jgi:hypothetical protein